MILILKPILVSYYHNFVLVTKFLKTRFWEGIMILLSKESPSISLNFLRQKLLEMVPLWNGYAIMFDICIPSFHHFNVHLVCFCHLISCSDLERPSSTVGQQFQVNYNTLLIWQAEDFVDPDVHHRHVSHLFGLFPGHTISVEKTPDLCKAVEVSLIKRGLL